MYTHIHTHSFYYRDKRQGKLKTLLQSYQFFFWEKCTEEKNEPMHSLKIGLGDFWKMIFFENWPDNNTSQFSIKAIMNTQIYTVVCTNDTCVSFSCLLSSLERPFLIALWSSLSFSLLYCLSLHLPSSSFCSFRKRDWKMMLWIKWGRCRI